VATGVLHATMHALRIVPIRKARRSMEPPVARGHEV